MSGLQSRIELLTHFVVLRKFQVEIRHPLAMLNGDENVIDELTSVSSSGNQH